MNWGNKILIVYAVFVIGIMLLVYKSSTQNTDLVTTDYYTKELAFQNTIEEGKRANELSETMKLNQSDSFLVITMPEEMMNSKLSADVTLYCPSNQEKDIRANLSTENGVIKLPLLRDIKGLYELHIRWKANDKYYYKEEKLVFK